jgi:MFS family permease
VRLTITETPVFRQAVQRDERVRVPMLTVFTRYPRAMLLGTLSALATFVLFYLMTVFALSWGTSVLGFTRQRFLLIQLFGILFFAATIPCSALLADRVGRRRTLLWVSAAIAGFGFLFAPLLVSSTGNVAVMMAVGLSLMGMTYGPLGTVLSEFFPTTVRYTGSSLTFNLAGIFGASLAPYIATWLATHHGLRAVGYYLTAAAVLTWIALYFTPETKDAELDSDGTRAADAVGPPSSRT